MVNGLTRTGQTCVMPRFGLLAAYPRGDLTPSAAHRIHETDFTRASPGWLQEAASPENRSRREDQRRSKRSSSVTFTHAATKSLTNFSLASLLA